MKHRRKDGQHFWADVTVTPDALARRAVTPNGGRSIEQRRAFAPATVPSTFADRPRLPKPCSSEALLAMLQRFSKARD